MLSTACPDAANQIVRQWVEEVTKVTTPDRVLWCDGSEGEHKEVLNRGVADGTSTLR